MKTDQEIKLFSCNKYCCYVQILAMFNVLHCSPDLTWRDVQYLIVYTSNPLLTDTTNSFENGAGLLVSRQFGFGVIDAEAMVTRARHWINVPPQLEETIIPTISSG